jgi:hypothetical protein
MDGSEPAAVWPADGRASCSYTAATAAVTASGLAVVPLLQLHHSISMQLGKPSCMRQWKPMVPYFAPNVVMR